MTSSESTNKGLRGTPESAKTRILLTLWDMGASESAVKKGTLTRRLIRTKERASDYQPILDELESAGAIAIDKNKVSLTVPTGLQMLEEGLKHFKFEGKQIGTKLPNALLQWIGKMYDGGVSTSIAPEQTAPVPTPTPVSPASPEGKLAQPAPSPITDYEQFKPVVLEVYDRLNGYYNLDDLVPIYLIRRDIGDRVTRSDFNDWMTTMQAEDMFQLMAGEMPDMTPDKHQDSIVIPGVGLRYYAKRL
ncbi:hypothetical protein [Phormidium sp. CCY1219]|uniref:hypothetical protein n=1 Tax=Phormidium sp. CCY1219 TaxID=2886104 RepID=UPI002D1EF3D7|nr:hypothetical protein [Phormidium sp. CCY1219]MEB3827272.1 hypothetical protein [Phormidium sp. CCY1219]